MGKSDFPKKYQSLAKMLEYVLKLVLIFEFMKKKTAFLLSTALLFVCGSLLSAPNEDPVIIDNGRNGVKFESIQKSQISNSGGPVTRITIPLKALTTPEKDKWVRNVSVELTVVYRDEKAKKKDSSFLVFKSSAKLFAIKVNQSTPVQFFIPWEAYEIYGLKNAPCAWRINLKVNGEPVEWTKANIDSFFFMEPSLMKKTTDLKAAYDAFDELVKRSAGYNENVLVPLPLAPFAIRYYQCYRNPNEVSPTYIVNSQ